MITYIYQFDDESPKVVMELSSESTLPEAIEAFEKFLLGAGYSFEGHLDFVSDESEEVK